MMNRWKILEDNHEDDALSIIRKLNARTGWTKNAQNLQGELGELLKSKGYIRFWSTVGCFHASKIGNSFLYDVPLYKRGILEEFRGKRVRIICISSGLHFDREYMAGEVGLTPANKLVEKIGDEYSFPNLDGFEVVYSSRRFKVVKPQKNRKIPCSLEPSGFIDFDSYDAALIDGVKGIPIAKLRYLDDGFMEGTLAGSNYWQRFRSLRREINHLGVSSDRRHKRIG